METPIVPVAQVPPISGTKRTFSKQLVVVNCLLAWATIFMSIYYGQSQWIAISAFGLITVINAYYMEVGHRDLTKLLNNITATKTENSDMSVTTYSGPAMPEPPKEETSA